MDAHRPVQGQGQGQQVFRIRPAPALPLQGHRDLAAGQQHRRRLRRLAGLHGAKRQRGVLARHVAGFSLDGVAEDHRRPSHFLHLRGRRLEAALGPGDDPGVGGLEGGTAGFRGLGGGRSQGVGDRRRHVDGEFFDDAQGVFGGGGIGDSGARGNDRRVVAGNVGNQQADDAGRTGGGGQAAALDGAQVLAHAVHLADGGAGSE